MKDDSYEEHRNLLLHIENAKKPNSGCEPHHVHVAHQRELQKELVRCENIVQKLDNFTVLINLMTVETLTVITQQDATSFLQHALKVLPSGNNKNNNNNSNNSKMNLIVLTYKCRKIKIKVMNVS